MLDNELTVVVICFDPYIDAIELSPVFFDYYWSNIKLPVIFVTSNLDIDCKYTVIKTNGKLSYFERLKAAIDVVKTPYILLLLDDYLINKPINEELIQENINFMNKNNAMYCELFTMFRRPRGSKLDKSHILVSQKTKYRINLQPSIYSKDLLKELLLDLPVTAWDAELSFMDEKYKRIPAFYSTNKSFSIINYIDKGKATRKAVRFLKKHNLWHNQREVNSIGLSLKYWFVRRYYLFVPQKIKTFLKKGKKVYK